MMRLAARSRGGCHLVILDFYWISGLARPEPLSNVGGPGTLGNIKLKLNADSFW